MIAGCMRADQVAPVLRSSDSSKRQTRTAREIGAILRSRPSPGERDGTSVGSCRECSGTEWAVEPDLAARQREAAESGLLAEALRLVPPLSADRPRPVRERPSFRWQTLEPGTELTLRPSAASSRDLQISRPFASRENSRTPSHRQSTESRAL